MRPSGKTKRILEQIFDKLYSHFGPRHWWPADTPFEVAVGAVLTQNTSWTNVEKAIASLKREGVLELAAMRALPPERLSSLIRPAGYYNLKEKRLRNLLDTLTAELDGRVENLARLELDQARGLLLNVKGVGPETADSILLYAAGMPTFVIDAYTKRVLVRHGLANEKSAYHEMRKLFMDHLKPDVQYFNEYHALLVRVSKYHCKKTGFECGRCPLESFLRG